MSRLYRRALMARKRVNVGGTSGGLGEFLIGVLLIIVGFYMIFTNTIVFTSFWYFQGYNLLGPLIIVFMLGLVFLSMNSGSMFGWFRRAMTSITHRMSLPQPSGGSHV